MKRLNASRIKSRLCLISFSFFLSLRKMRTKCSRRKDIYMTAARRGSFTRSCANRCRTSNEHVKEIYHEKQQKIKKNGGSGFTFLSRKSRSRFLLRITPTGEKLPEHGLGLKTKRERRSRVPFARVFFSPLFV